MTETATDERPAPTEQYPALGPDWEATRPLPVVSRSRIASIRAWLAGRIGALTALSPAVWIPAVAAVLVAAVALALIESGGGHGRGSLAPPPGLVVVGSSWVTGEPSLAVAPEFISIENRAVALANVRYPAYVSLLAEIAAAKKAAAARRRAELLKKYEELRARELAKYRAEVKRIQKLRAEALAKERAAKLKYERELAKYLKERTVTPGQECRDPAVAQSYACQNGLLPAGKSKKAPKKQGH
jgi:hypothetical protein